MSDKIEQAQESKGKGKSTPQSPFTPDMLAITGEDLIEFFEQMDPEPCCPVCKRDMKVMAAVDFDEEGNPKGFRKRPALVGVPIHEDPEHNVEFKTPCFAISCSNCGHLAYFMVNPVVKWKESHGRKG